MDFTTVNFLRGPDGPTRGLRLWHKERMPCHLHEVIDAAVLKLRQLGWTQNEEKSRTGRVCAIGAIKEAVIACETEKIEADWVVPYVASLTAGTPAMEVRLRGPVWENHERIVELTILHVGEVLSYRTGPLVGQTGKPYAEQAGALIAHFNDMQGRKMAEVIAVLEGAANEARRHLVRAHHDAAAEEEARRRIEQRANEVWRAERATRASVDVAEAAADAVIGEVLALQPRPLSVPLPEPERTPA